MAQAPTTAEQRDQTARTAADKATKPQFVLVELGKRQSPKQIKKLRQGRGKLMRKIHGIVAELTEAGTVSAKSQPVVIIVREQAALPWPFAPMQSDDDNDDNDNNNK
jgi:hypothetical protein